MSNPGKLYWHEALDRMTIIYEDFIERVKDEVAVQSDPDLRSQAEEVEEAMGKFRTAISGRWSAAMKEDDGG